MLTIMQHHAHSFTPCCRPHQACIHAETFSFARRRPVEHYVNSFMIRLLLYVTAFWV